MSNSTERIGNGTVSIIIPVYNAEMVLSRCLDSVLRQTYHSIEILAIDDGSTDSSGAILDEYARSDLRIKVIHTENHGVGTARNIGLDEASGDYISFVDADDVVNPHYIERLVNVLLETNTDVSTCCAIDLPDDELREIKDNWNVNEEKPIILAINPSCTAEQFFDYTQPTAHTVVWGGVYDRDVLRGIRFSADLSVGEDTLFFASVLKKVRRVSYVEQPLYCYVQYCESAAHGALNERKFHEVLAREKVCYLFDGENKEFVSGARASLAMTAKKLLTDMQLQKYDDANWRKRLITLMRINLGEVLVSNYRAKAKVAIFLCAMMPGIYFRVN